MSNINRTTLQRLLSIALPMVVSQASDSIMMFVDRVFLSRVGELHLAASMAGGLTMFMLSSFFVGTVGYVTAIVAQYYGAKRYEQCGEATFQSILVALVCYPLLLGLSPLVRYFFVLAGHQPQQIELGYLYFQTLIFGSVFLILRYALAGFFLGIGRTTVVMLANIVGMIVNIPANYVLIFGKFGFPALGLQGAAIGTIAGNATIFVILLLFYLRGANRSQFNTNRSLKFRPQIMGKLLRFGVPAGFEMFLSVTAFNLFVQFMHSYGTVVAAAVTITFNWDIVAFIPMLGMSHATTALVGQNIGAGDREEARRSTYVALRVAWVYSGAMVLLFVFATRYLVGAFSSGFGANAAQIASLAIVMLRLAAVYTLADSAQLVFTGALRGAGDTRWVMRTSIGLHWVFSGIAIFLIRSIQADPVTVWLVFIAFVIGLGLVMFMRFRSGKWRQIELIKS
ncbi:MAG: MATE family efflux transporter [Spirochaetaceae bacterium]|nr:MAG: MATE family efflux transporter [Spirochaetaceae bacterium]